MKSTKSKKRKEIEREREALRKKRAHRGCIKITANSEDSTEFLDSWEWTTLRYSILNRYGRRCMCCGATPKDKVTIITVDHVKPRHTHPHLALDPNNLQVLCYSCNKGKGAWDTTDFR